MLLRPFTSLLSAAPSRIATIVVSATIISMANAAAPAAPTFAALDTNSDGKISLNEASVNDDLFVAFKKLDGNRDGELTQAEFAAYSGR